MQSRMERLQERMESFALSALLVTKAEHIFYLSGFSGSSGALFITPGHHYLASDFRYVLQAAQEAPEWEFILAKESLQQTLRELFANAGCVEIGFEAEDVTLMLFRQLGGEDGAAPYRLKPSADIIAPLREVKDPDELKLIREAIRITDEAYVHVVSLVRPGITEIELALEAEWYMRRHGADGMAFDIIVAAGAHSALPHAQPGPRALQAGDLVVIDMGAKVAHYCADLTRTFAVSIATPIAQEIYRVCLAAQLAGIANIRAGIPGHAADRLVRDVIEQAGYGDAFGHGTGHGIGLEIHEAPRLRRISDDMLQVGATVTVEPGIYLEGVGGVRIEDSVIVGEAGVEVMTAAAKPANLPVFG